MKNIIFIISIILLCSCAIAQESPKFGGSIKIGLPADITTIYPWKMTDTETVYVLENVYEPLIRLKKESAGIEPGLATDWAPSSDYKTWTVHLRKNVKFHDGSPFNADAVAETLTQNISFPAKIKKLDAYTLSFNLDQPDAAFAISLSLQYYIITSKATVKCFKENCTKLAAYGTGPFKLVSWQQNKELVLQANENYWGGRPYLKEAIFIPYIDTKKLVQALRDGTVDMVPAVSADNMTEIRQIPNVVFQSRQAMNIAYLGMNTQKPPFNNKKVRIAISYAINKKQLINKYYFNGQAGAVAKSCLPPAMFGYYKDLPDREYNPGKAKTLLKEAGYPKGFQTTLLPPPVNRAYLPNPTGIAEDIKIFLEQIGIKVQIAKSPSYKQFRDDVHSGQYEMTIYGWIADTIDPNDFLTALLATSSIDNSNSPRWSNQQFDVLITKARGVSMAERIKTYQEAQQLFYEEMPFVPFANSLLLGAWKERVKGFQLHPASRFFLQHIWLE